MPPEANRYAEFTRRLEDAVLGPTRGAATDPSLRMAVEARAASSGTALVMTASALALLAHRSATGQGGWAETSLYDGMIATLGCMIGRSERATVADLYEPA